MVILPQDLVIKHIEHLDRYNQVPVSFVTLDAGDVFLSTEIPISRANGKVTVNGVLRFIFGSQVSNEINFLPANVDVIVTIITKKSNPVEILSINDFQFSAQVRGLNNQVEQRPVQVIPIREEIFSRIHGLYETDVLQRNTALIIGLGSGGALIASELAKASVGSFILIDHDRLEIANVVRHICGISDLGRFKTKAVRDVIFDKNPFANIETYEEEISWKWLPNLLELMKRADIVFCCTDNRPSRAIINFACISTNRICIYGGTFRRAYGGQVLRVIPGKTMCYQCFIDTLVADPGNQEILNQIQAQREAYSDRPVPIEPGLATDIAPISIMCVKLGILEMLRGTNTTFENLYEDLSGPLFQWLNRREADTDYSDLKPMDSGVDNLRILAWYGIENEKNPGCPVCGDFIGTRTEYAKERPTIDQIAAYGPNPNRVLDERIFPTVE